MKKLLLLLLLIAMTACAAEKAFEDQPEEKEEKVMKSLAYLMQFKQKGVNSLSYSDKWYIYNATFHPVVAGQFDNVSATNSKCTIDTTDVTIIDKTQNYKVVVKETLTQTPCSNCHAR